MVWVWSSRATQEALFIGGNVDTKTPRLIAKMSNANTETSNANTDTTKGNTEMT